MPRAPQLSKRIKKEPSHSSAAHLFKGNFLKDYPSGITAHKYQPQPGVLNKIDNYKFKV